MKYLVVTILALFTTDLFAQEPAHAFLLKLIYGNAKMYGSDVLADHDVTVDDFNSTCNNDKKLTFQITAKKSYTVKGVPAMLIFTSAPTLNMNCPVAAGVAYLKKTNNVWKVIDSRKYFLEVGNVGQGGFYDFVQITDNDYAGLAYTDKLLNGVESTNLTIVGVFNDKITDFTSAGPVTISQRNRSSGNMKPIWSSKVTFERGEDEVFVMIMNKNVSKSNSTGEATETTVYQFNEGTFKP